MLWESRILRPETLENTKFSPHPTPCPCDMANSWAVKILGSEHYGQWTLRAVKIMGSEHYGQWTVLMKTNTFPYTNNIGWLNYLTSRCQLDNLIELFDVAISYIIGSNYLTSKYLTSWYLIIWSNYLTSRYLILFDRIIWRRDILLFDRIIWRRSIWRRDILLFDRIIWRRDILLFDRIIWRRKRLDSGGSKVTKLKLVCLSCRVPLIVDPFYKKSKKKRRVNGGSNYDPQVGFEGKYGSKGEMSQPPGADNSRPPL